jgi:sulfur carrier protein ThiS
MMMKIQANGLTITVEQDSDEEYKLEELELTAKAVVTLIEMADIHSWQKDHLSHDVLSLFIAAILVELAQTYAHEANLPDDKTLKLPSGGHISIPQGLPLHEFLPIMLGHLKDAGMLDRIIKSHTDDGDDDDLN